MNTTASSTQPPALSSTELDERIRAEGQRLLIEQNLEQGLAQQRLAPLEAGDDAALDRIEQQINECRDRQIRIQERVDLLNRRVEEARQRERDAELDHVVAVANRAREIGERLITEDYAEHAAVLVEVLGKLAAINALIDAANQRTTGTDRKNVAKPNLIRCHPGREWTEKETVRVGIHDRDHPHYGKAELSTNNPNVAYLKDGGETVPATMVIEREVLRRADMRREPDLVGSVVLPGVGPAPEGSGLTALWDERKAREAAANLPSLRAEIEASLTQEAASTTRSEKHVADQRK
jgi:hypothetical protein